MNGQLVNHFPDFTGRVRALPSCHSYTQGSCNPDCFPLCFLDSGTNFQTPSVGTCPSIFKSLLKTLLCTSVPNHCCHYSLKKNIQTKQIFLPLYLPTMASCCTEALILFLNCKSLCLKASAELVNVTATTFILCEYSPWTLFLNCWTAPAKTSWGERVFLFKRSFTFITKDKVWKSQSRDDPDMTSPSHIWVNFLLLTKNCLMQKKKNHTQQIVKHVHCRLNRTQISL